MYLSVDDYHDWSLISSCAGLCSWKCAFSASCAVSWFGLLDLLQPDANIPFVSRAHARVLKWQNVTNVPWPLSPMTALLTENWMTEGNVVSRLFFCKHALLLQQFLSSFLNILSFCHTCITVSCISRILIPFAARWCSCCCNSCE